MTSTRILTQKRNRQGLKTTNVDSRKNAVSVTLNGLGEESERGRFIVVNQQAVVQSGQSGEPQDEQVAEAENQPKAIEYGGPKGPEPTRYGDWEQAGRCTDF
jgi:hypothetical protein